MLSNILSLSLLSLLLPITASAAAHGNPILNRHHDIARRADGHIDVFKRAAGAKMSYYNVQTGNAGSCGRFHVNSDFTVALNAAQMNKGLCFKTIRISYGGKTATATISDTCPGCPWNGLDLTEGLFAFFAPHSVGIIHGDWEFTDAAPPSPAPPKTTSVWVPPTTTKKSTPAWTPPTTTWSPKPTPTSTWVPPPPTTTRTSTTRIHSSSSSSVSSSSSSSQSHASSSASSSSSGSSSSPINYSTGAAAGLAVPTGTVNRTPGSAENLADLYQVFIQVGGVAAAANNL
ncbi:Allergen Asp f 7-like protein [Psilocybe cubensis]|uniref:Uncharacterized protein n=2 Tax=Psilocybe cubensis TaxID=181762 RepID=A0A8H7Y502_PSICU|nr:Allergen Asp f 7-like protein [Psilocybe cubensis]KAH9483974.1 Allergen Asp f 7-like protein [Psilocybe cubensis]